MTELATSLRAYGLLQPLVVRPVGDRYELVAGHRRLAAFRALSDAEPDDPTLADGLLLATTELTTSGDIARFVAALQEVLSGRPPVGVETGAGVERAANPVGATR